MIDMPTLTDSNLAIQDSLDLMRPLHFMLASSEDMAVEDSRVQDFDEDFARITDWYEVRMTILETAGMVRRIPPGEMCEGCWDLTTAGVALLREHGELE